MWPPRRLGLLYSKIYGSYGLREFSLGDVVPMAGSYRLAKLYIHRLRRIGWAYRVDLDGGVRFRLSSPEVCALQASGAIRNLDRIGQQAYRGLIERYIARVLRKGPRIRAAVMFGSVARGRAGRESDVDLLVVVDGDVRGAWKRLVEHEWGEEVEEEVRWLESKGIHTRISVLPMSVNRFREHPFILLDIVDDGIPIYDDGVYEEEAEKIRRNLKRLGARRVFISEDEWYWNLKPDYRPNEVIEI